MITSLALLFKGLLAGLAIAAPVGPVNVLCISRTLAKGRNAGLVSGLGAATADGLYGSIAAFSITFIIQLLIRDMFWIRLIGGIVLMGIGAVYYFKRPKSLKEQERPSSEGTDFVSTLFLTLTNPTTVLSFLAVLAALGLARNPSHWLTLWLVLGIFSGSMLWWVLLVVVVNRLRDRFDDRSLVWMNRIAGLAIGGFGAFTFLLSRHS
jgi:threonine/homoserine/homoserine lactone efflux protein